VPEATWILPVAQLVSVHFLQKNELTQRHEAREIRIISQDENLFVETLLVSNAIR
jgi:hypothetical protein